VTFLLGKGADHRPATKVVDLATLTAGDQPARPGAAAGAKQIPGLTRQFRYNELIGTQGGLTALLFATREGYTASATALLAGGADINQANPGDGTTPLLMAVINGHFDLAMTFLAKGADVSRSAANGAAPLYATLNHRWAPKSQYPNPKGYQQQTTSYLQVMQALLDKGADPNARIRRKVWYQAFNSDFAGVDEIGATPFWRAAYASDVEAMRLLVKYGADPHIPTVKPAGRPFTGDGIRQTTDVSGIPPPVGGPAVPPLLAAAGGGYGEGFAANSHRYAETGFLHAIRYLVEEVGADVNAVDHEGNTAVHLAASRGDNASIEYLVRRAPSTPP
jgi:ankyrin repeat protein